MSNDLPPPPRPEENTVTSVAAESRREIRMRQASIAILVCLRLWMMATNPLTDTTEARYGELARVTADGGFWQMSHMTPTEPFFAKLPLSTPIAAHATLTILG